MYRPNNRNIRDSGQKQHNQINKDDNNYATVEDQIVSTQTILITESTPLRNKKESFHGTPPIPQKMEKKEIPKPTTS